jgi:DNA anti-recombination protein RmuC
LKESNRENYRILNQVWEIRVPNFNGAETCFRKVFNDLNEMKKVSVNNQEIVAKQNMIQINLLAKVDESLQRGFKPIGIRITREFENELALLQVQVITQLEQMFDIIINVNMQRVKQEFNHLIEVGLERLFNEIKKLLVNNQEIIVR